MNRTVLKPGSHQAASRGGCHVDLRDFSQQARTLIESAQAEARSITEQARRQADQRSAEQLQSAQRRGYEEGLARGREAGLAKALEDATATFASQQGELVASLRKLLDEFKGARERLLVEARQDVITLSLAIASRVVTQLTKIDAVANTAAQESCREAIDLIAGRSEAVIRANPEDCAILERFAADIAKGLNDRHVRLAADPSIKRGGVIVETADTQVDATVKEKLIRLADELAADWRTRMGPLNVDSEAGQS